MKKLILTVSLLVFANYAYSNFINYSQNKTMDQTETMNAQKTVKLKCTEMSCQKCVKSIEKSINKLPGISDLNIDLESKIISVTFDESKTDVQSLLNAIVEAGYEAEVLTDGQ
jgi:periplasmic mercuric ion binding protein